MLHIFLYLCDKDTIYFDKNAMPNATKQSFPHNSPRIREVEGEKYIWDSLRGKWLLLTPEEQVRQATISKLIAWGIPPLRITQEYPVNVNGQHQRADIVVMNNTAKPHILVECKAPEVDIDEEVARQAMRYNAIVGARYVLLTNGRKAFAFEFAEGKYRPLSSFDEMLQK